MEVIILQSQVKYGQFGGVGVGNRYLTKIMQHYMDTFEKYLLNLIPITIIVKFNGGLGFVQIFYTVQNKI